MRPASVLALRSQLACCLCGRTGAGVARVCLAELCSALSAALLRPVAYTAHRRAFLKNGPGSAEVPQGPLEKELMEVKERLAVIESESLDKDSMLHHAEAELARAQDGIDEAIDLQVRHLFPAALLSHSSASRVPFPRAACPVPPRCAVLHTLERAYRAALARTAMVWVAVCARRTTLSSRPSSSNFGQKLIGTTSSARLRLPRRCSSGSRS